MSQTFRNFLSTSALVVSALVAAPAQAGPFSNTYVFGDSLSDSGNLNALTGGTFPRLVDGPYFNGRFSDGPVWVEGLAALLGVANDAAPALVPGSGGKNFAIAGARTGASANPSDPPSVLVQLGGLWGVAPGMADPNALYVLVAGGNDMRDARTAFLANTEANKAARQAAAQATADNLVLALGALKLAGAEHVLISNLPNLAGSPEALLLELNGAVGTVAASDDVSRRFNALVDGYVFNSGVALGLGMTLLNMAGVGELVALDAATNAGGVYGITNATAPCTGFAFSALLGGTDCSKSVFSDALHPSAAAHSIIATAAFGLVPEPGGMLLVATAIAALVATRRRT